MRTNLKASNDDACTAVTRRAVLLSTAAALFEWRGGGRGADMGLDPDVVLQYLGKPNVQAAKDVTVQSDSQAPVLAADLANRQIMVKMMLNKYPISLLRSSQLPPMMPKAVTDAFERAVLAVAPNARRSLRPLFAVTLQKYQRMYPKWYAQLHENCDNPDFDFDAFFSNQRAEAKKFFSGKRKGAKNAVNLIDEVQNLYEKVKQQNEITFKDIIEMGIGHPGRPCHPRFNALLKSFEQNKFVPEFSEQFFGWTLPTLDRQKPFLIVDTTTPDDHAVVSVGVFLPRKIPLNLSKEARQVQLETGVRNPDDMLIRTSKLLKVDKKLLGVGMNKLNIPIITILDLSANESSTGSITDDSLFLRIADTLTLWQTAELEKLDSLRQRLAANQVEGLALDGAREEIENKLRAIQEMIVVCHGRHVNAAVKWFQLLTLAQNAEIDLHQAPATMVNRDDRILTALHPETRKLLESVIVQKERNTCAEGTVAGYLLNQHYDALKELAKANPSQIQEKGTCGDILVSKNRLVGQCYVESLGNAMPTVLLHNPVQMDADGTTPVQSYVDKVFPRYADSTLGTTNVWHLFGVETHGATFADVLRSMDKNIK